MEIEEERERIGSFGESDPGQDKAHGCRIKASRQRTFNFMGRQN